MKDVALHLLDIIENAAKAGASRIDVRVAVNHDVFQFAVSDNGPGFPADVAADPLDPYRTTRSERPVGLGLAFLREAAEQTGGQVVLTHGAGQGVRVEASFRLDHIDAKPVGDLAGVLATAAIGWPADLAVFAGEPPECLLDMALVRQELDGLPLSHPEVSRFIEQTLRTGLESTVQAADDVFGRARSDGSA